MKSVCVLLQNPYDIDVRVRRKAEALVVAGYTVDVLALRGDRGEKAYCLNGVNVYTVGLGKRRGTLARYLFEYGAFFVWVLFRVSRQMLKRRYDVIDVNTLPDFLIFAAIVAKWMGAKLLLDMHEITPEFYMSKYGISGSSWLIWLLKYVERMSFRFADQVITIHEPIRDLLVDRGLTKAKSTVVMNSVDEARFVERRQSSEAVGATSAGQFVMMYHGTLTRIYGLELAIEAFAIAHNEMAGAEFWILGEGPEKASLESLARERGVGPKVKLFGRVAPDEVAAWLHRCDVGILPMRRDAFLEFAFPNKLSEYIVLGKGVVVARLKAIRHYFSEEAFAYFQPGSAHDLAKQMVRVFGDGDFRAGLAAKARAEYVPIGWDVMRSRYLELVGRMVGLNGRAGEALDGTAARGTGR